MKSVVISYLRFNRFSLARFDSFCHVHLLRQVKHDKGGYAEINTFPAGSPFPPPTSVPNTNSARIHEGYDDDDNDDDDNDDDDNDGDDNDDVDYLMTTMMTMIMMMIMMTMMMLII